MPQAPISALGATAFQTDKQAYLPDFTAVFIALSAWLKPSAEPGARKLRVSMEGADLRAWVSSGGRSPREISHLTDCD